MRYFSTLFLLVIIASVTAQNDRGKMDDAGRIVLVSDLSDDIEGLDNNAQSFLLNKLDQITLKYGMGGSALNKRFIITANITIVTKDITSTAPPMHAYTLDVSFYIGDGIEGTLFSSTSMTLKGVGETDTKAYNAALKNIKTTDPRFESFIEEGKNKIIEYYNSKCDLILNEAIAKANTKEYEEAMYSLSLIPTVCKDCYDKALDTLIFVYRMKVENECQENISKAKSYIAKNDYESASSVLSNVTPDLKCYPETDMIIQQILDHRCSVSLGKARGAWANRDSKLAASYLSEIPSDSKCYPDALSLFRDITSNLDANEQREWNLAYEKYNRSQTMSEQRQESNIALQNRQMTYEENQSFELKKAQINAAKVIGVAYGKNQPKRTTYNYRNW